MSILIDYPKTLRCISVLFMLVAIFTPNGIAAETPTCISSLTQSKCAMKKQFIEYDASKGVCPRCRGGLGFAVSGCNERSSRRRCAPGLRCTNGQCLLDKSELVPFSRRALAKF